MTKYIIITGGIATGTGKTCLASSIGYILSTYGMNISMIKFDGILNLNFKSLINSKSKEEIIWDGEEVFITKNGNFLDSDIGSYERFLHKDFSSLNNIVSGECYNEIIKNQLSGRYKKGEIITINSHLIPLYLKKIYAASKNSDVCIIEIGGTLGDYESLFFIKALNTLKNINPKKFISLHYCYLPLKSSFDISEKEPFLLKIVKQSVDKANLLSINTDILVVRSDIKLLNKHKKRIMRDCFLNKDKIWRIPSVKDIYTLPIEILNSKQYRILINLLGITKRRIKGNLERFNELKIKNVSKVLIIGETESSGSYISLKEAVKHSLKSFGYSANIKWIKGSQIENEIIKDYDYIIITDGKENIRGKRDIINNYSLPILCIGNICNTIKINKINCFYINKHIEYRSKHMNPSLNKFFKKWKKD